MLEPMYESSAKPAQSLADTRSSRPKPAVMIVVHCYPDGGGISSIVENYATELADRFNVHIVTVEGRVGWRERADRLPAKFHVLGYSNAINPSLMPTSLAYAVRVGLGLRRLRRSYQPTVLITQDGLNLPIPGLVATWGSDCRLVVMDHGTLTNIYEPRWLPMFLSRLTGLRRLGFRLGFLADSPWRAVRWRIGVRLADRLWYTGSELKPWFARAGARAVEYSQTVPRDFVPAEPDARAAARVALGISPSDRVINYVGRLDGEKGLDTIVAALARVDRSSSGIHDWKALFAGDGSMEQWLRVAIERHGLRDRVRLLGRLDRPAVAALHGASDLHVYAGTISCGVSICLLEAMAAGVVPVVSDVPALQVELVGEAGWVFSAGDTDGLSSALSEALAVTDEELEHLKAEASARVRLSPHPTVPSLIDDLVFGVDPRKLKGTQTSDAR